MSQIPLTADLQQSIQEEWSSQYSAFCDDIREVPFDAGYKPEEDERFTITGFSLPEQMETNREGLDTLDPIGVNEQSLHQLNAIFAYATLNGNEVVIIQRFSRSHILKPGRFMYVRNGTFETASSPALTLGNKPDVVYFPSEQKLVFANFRNANAILPLIDFYQEASESEIRQVLSHPRISAEDIDSLAVNAPQWYRTRFSMLRDSKVLDDYTPSQIKEDAAGYLDIETIGADEDEKLVFPKEKPEARRLLQFLNEELYKGPITEILYETNSNRAAEAVS